MDELLEDSGFDPERGKLITSSSEFSSRRDGLGFRQVIFGLTSNGIRFLRRIAAAERTVIADSAVAMRSGKSSRRMQELKTPA